VIRALRDTLLICACRLFQLGNPFKARIELNSGNALRWNRKTLKNTPASDAENDAKPAEIALPEAA